MTIGEVINLAGITDDVDLYQAATVLGCRTHPAQSRIQKETAWRQVPWNGIVCVCRYKYVPDRIRRTLNVEGILYSILDWADMRS